MASLSFAHKSPEEDHQVQLSMIFNQTIDLIDSSHNHILNDLNQGWFSQCYLKAFVDSVHRKWAALDNVWGIIDRTVDQR